MIKKRVLIICPYPRGWAAGQRLKYEQYISHWEKNGYEVTISSFFDLDTWRVLYIKNNYIKKILGTIKGYLKRIRDIKNAEKYDLVYIFLWVSPLGKFFFEKALLNKAKKVIYDFDDSIFLDSKDWFQNILRNPKKFHYLIKNAQHVVLSSPFNLDKCLEINRNKSVSYIPCSLDTSRFKPIKNNAAPKKKVVLGWTGTFSSIPYLNSIKNILIKLKQERDFKLLLITNFDYEFSEMDLEIIEWKKESEIADLNKIDIGLYPIHMDEWSLGKGGLKMMQYMAIGIPGVATNYGTAQNIITHGSNGYLVSQDHEWVDVLKLLIDNEELRSKIGAQALYDLEKNYSYNAVKDLYLNILNTV
jgi:glycosyltransferase involved in cell wall biosynthesis